MERNFTLKYNKVCDLGKLYFLHKTQKKLSNDPERSVISNCGMPLEKISHNQLKSVLQKGKFCIRDSGLFFEKTENINTFLENAIILTANVVDLSPVTLHQPDLRALKCIHPFLCMHSYG